MNFPSDHENRLEPDSLLSNIAVRAALGAPPDIAYGLEIGLLEAILVALDNDAVAENLEQHVGYVFLTCCLTVLVVVGILQELEDEASLAGVEILGQAVTTLTRYSEVTDCVTNVRTDEPIFSSLVKRASSTSRRTSGLNEPIHSRLSSLTKP